MPGAFRTSKSGESPGRLDDRTSLDDEQRARVTVFRVAPQ